MSRASRLLAAAALMGLTLSACGSPSEPRISAQEGPRGQSADATTTTRTPSATIDEVGVLFAGLPLGVTDYFEPIEDAAGLRDRSATTIVGTFEGYEVLRDGPLMVAGYAGPSGVLRLYFSVESVVGGRAVPREAPGRERTRTIAVDYDYWVAPSMLGSHREALDGLIGRARALLFLRGGTTDGKASTGTYRLWEDPFAVLASSDGVLGKVSIPSEYVEAEALERGRKLVESGSVTTTPSPHEEEEPASVGEVDARTILSPLYGQTEEKVLNDLSAPGGSQEVVAPGSAPLE